MCRNPHGPKMRLCPFYCGRCAWLVWRFKGTRLLRINRLRLQHKEIIWRVCGWSPLSAGHTPVALGDRTGISLRLKAVKCQRQHTRAICTDAHPFSHLLLWGRGTLKSVLPYTGCTLAVGVNRSVSKKAGNSIERKNSQPLEFSVVDD